MIKKYLLNKSERTDFYGRPTKAKNKMSVLNAVKNKLLARVIAVVNKQEEYEKKAA